MAKFRFGIVGAGNCGIRTYGGHLRGRYADRGDLVAMADLDETRLSVATRLLGVETSYRSADDLIAAPDVDVVVITTPDHTHTEIALSAMEAGKHIICEKPVATTVADANRLLEASRSFDKSFLVGFVLRYAPFFAGMHSAIDEGRIGKPHFAAAVDNRAGGGYFRSWHRLRRFSGGLLNHKSGHTLDIINWMLGQRPVAVSATGGIAHYGPRDWAGQHCRDCAVAEICPEYVDISIGLMGELFAAADDSGDSKTDRCVYNSDKDTVDHATLNIEYDGGAKASYGLCLFAPYNQRELGVMGARGKLEGREGDDGVRLTLRSTYPQPRRDTGRPASDELLEVRAVGGEGVMGGHGGGDVGLLDDCFDALEGKRDPIADLEAGYWSAMLGVTAEESVARGGLRLEIGESMRGGV